MKVVPGFALRDGVKNVSLDGVLYDANFLTIVLRLHVVPDREFYVPSIDDCVNVMAYLPPAVVGGERWLVPPAAS